jgi:predicted polyphosphate/ATP-dependent NAD kinase
MDFGKYRYEQEQKAKEARKHQTTISIKEIKLRPKIDDHDFDTKKGHVERFLKKGDKVKLTIMFRGRRRSEAGTLSLVGIIANPASGKDIRRVVSQATTVNNHEKVSIVRRLLLALFASGVRRVEIMPDYFGIGARALDGLRDHPEIQAATGFTDLPLEGTAQDSWLAARYLKEAGAGCIVVLGGDGTCRVVAKGCGDVPLLPISTGTNNVVPSFVEGTVAGAAAAYVALQRGVERERLCWRHKRLLVSLNGQEVDQALVEVALVSSSFVGARAVWQADAVRQVFASRAQPVNIGMSAIPGVVQPVGPGDPGGVIAVVSRDSREVRVPIAPGSFVPVGIKEVLAMKPGILYRVAEDRPAVLALDGEREITLHAGDEAEVRLDLEGPWIVDVSRTLLQAVADGMFWTS